MGTLSRQPERQNLTDKDYRDQSLSTVFFEGYGPGQTWKLEFDARF
jgi:hypothetical protein